MNPKNKELARNLPYDSLQKWSVQTTMSDDGYTRVDDKVDAGFTAFEEKDRGYFYKRFADFIQAFSVRQRHGFLLLVRLPISRRADSAPLLSELHG